MPTHQDALLQTSDGLSLYTQTWSPAEKAKGVVCVVHGLGEHSGRYAHVAHFLAGRGYILTAFDLRGHGRSPGKRGHSPTYEVLLDDIAQFLNQTRAGHPHLPLFLYGHSLGGNLVINFILKRNTPLLGAVSTSPWLRTAFEPPAWKLKLSDLLYQWWPGLALSTGLEQAALSHDEEVVRSYANDPLVHDRLTVRLATDALRNGEWAIAHAAELSIPLLLMHGSDDRLTSMPASREFAERAGDLCELRIWDGLYHELHNEFQKSDVMQMITNWLDALVKDSRVVGEENS